MGNSLRCCLACVLPCGAFDLIRVVHINGHVDEYSRQVTAGEILRANPNHVLSKPSSQTDGAHRIIVVSPDSDLKRGNIYFLVPSNSSSSPEKTEKKRRRRKKNEASLNAESDVTTTTAVITADVVSDTDAYLMEVVSEMKSYHKRRRSVRIGVWRPHLQSISEDDS